MTGKHKQLADAIRATKPIWKANGDDVPALAQWERMAATVADWLTGSVAEFDRALWLDYATGKCGPRGGKL